MPYPKIALSAVFILLLTGNIFGQTDTAKDRIMRWEASVHSGLFADLLYANIGVGSNDNITPSSYSTIKGRRMQLGKIDRLEIKYNINEKAALSLNFNYALWRTIYGRNIDPLELWTTTRRYKKRLQFSANYYRKFYADEKSELNVGLGFLVQQEQVSYPFYRISPVDSSIIEVISARGLQYFPDWGIQITGTYYRSINQNLKIGATFYTYLIGTAIDGAGIMGSIAIPFHKAKMK